MMTAEKTQRAIKVRREGKDFLIKDPNKELKRKDLVNFSTGEMFYTGEERNGPSIPNKIFLGREEGEKVVFMRIQTGKLYINDEGTLNILPHEKYERKTYGKDARAYNPLDSILAGAGI